MLGIAEQGKFHEYEPEADSLSFIDFEDGPLVEVYGGLAGARREWMCSMAIAVADEIGVAEAARAFRHILATLGEEAAWRYMGEVAVANGFDVYDSDSRFEIFEGGTTETYPA